ANWNSGNNEAKQNTQSNKFVSKTINIFVPGPVLEQFKKADLSQKKKFCDAQPSVWQKISIASKSPPQRIKGFNSRMDNGNQVEGHQASETFYLNMSEAFPDAMVNDDHREFILNQLYKWAEVGALTKTPNCFATRSCGKYWKRSDGQDPYPGHDINNSLLRGHFLAFGYFAAMPSYTPNDQRHLVIQKWLTSFLTDAPSNSRRSRYMDPYKWGLLLKGEINGNPDKNLANKILKSSFEHLYEDGSIKNHTNRGNRSLWYHSSGLNEIMINMEVARKYGIKIPKEMHARVQKSAEIFVRGLDDHAFMDKWASQGYRGKFVKGSQDYKRNLASVTGGVSWWYIFQYRYPNSPIAAELRRLTFQNPRTQDNLLGFGIGCIYRSLLPEVAGQGNSLNTTILQSSKAKTKKAGESKFVQPIKFNSAKSKMYSDKDNFIGFRITIDSIEGNRKIKVMVDFDDKAQKESGDLSYLRLEMPTENFLDPAKTQAAFGCKKSTIKKKGDTLTAYRLYSGKEEENNKCAFSTMTESGRKEAESLLATLGQIFADDNVKKSDPYGVLEKHSKLLIGATGN
ncbi:hypothetical protein N9361_09545, partial [Alphaproteobacteria bacterium]|nr:hypothetical protein [Alphaproteobacteria bacterium]